MESTFSGQALRAARQRQGKTLSDLSASAGVSYPSLVSYESGRVTPPPEKAARLAAALGVDLAQLADETQAA